MSVIYQQTFDVHRNDNKLNTHLVSLDSYKMKRSQGNITHRKWKKNKRHKAIEELKNDTLYTNVRIDLRNTWTI